MFHLSWFLLLVGGCAKQYAPPPPPPPPAHYAPAAPPPAEAYYDDVSESTFQLDGVAVAAAPAPPQRARDKSRRQRSKKVTRSSGSGSPEAEGPPPADPGAEALPVPDRMVHYDGWARMRVSQPEKTLDAIAAIATEAGGRVDNQTRTAVTVRVPVAQFDTLWRSILDLGDVMDKSVRADDITEQFLAVDLRVRSLRTMRDRLVRLLARAKSDEEKLVLLEQITRVTEELDATESRMRTLADLASMSRISIEAVPREAFGASQGGLRLAGFDWIQRLSPFNTAVFERNKRVALPVPDEMVSLTKTGPFRVETADGSRIWTQRVANDPVGSAAYWLSAIEERVAEEFDQPVSSTIGDWSCLSLDEPGAEEPYHWQICVTAEGRHLDLVQIYLPSPDHVERYTERIEAMLAGGGDA